MCIEGDVRLGVGNLTGFYASINDVEDYYFIKDELACLLIGHMEQYYVMTSGTIRKPLLSVHNLVSFHMNTCLYIAVYHHHYARE